MGYFALFNDGWDHRVYSFTGINIMRAKTLSFVGVCTLIAAGAALVQTPAFAQSATTTDDIICQMSGTCGDKPAPAGDKQAIGDEKMFSLQKAHAPAVSTPQPAAPVAASAAKKPAYYSSNTKAAKKVYAPVTQPTGELTMQVRFAMGSSDLTDDAKTELAKYVQAMQSPQLSGMKFVIQGHTDSSGKRATNLDLSQRRAQSVVDYLAANGVGTDRLQAQGFGPDKPISGLSKASPLNRRVELVRAN